MLPAMALLLAACGGGDDEPSATDGSAPPPATTTAPPGTADEAGDGSGGGGAGDLVTTEAPADTAPADTAPADTASADPAPADTAPADPAPADTGAVLDPTERPDPCSLWTAAEVSAATGITFVEGAFNMQLSVSGQQICDWLSADGGPLANAQVLLLAPGLDHDFLRSGTDAAFGPAVDIDVPGADAAHLSADGRILGLAVDGIVVQLAYLPPIGVDVVGAELQQLAAIAAARLRG